MIFVIFFMVVWYTVCAMLLVAGVLRVYRYRTCKGEAVGTVTAIRTVTGWSKSFGSHKKHRTEYRMLVVDFTDDTGCHRTVISSGNYGLNRRIGEECTVRYDKNNSALAHIVEPNTALHIGIILSLVPMLFVALGRVFYGVMYL